MGQMNQQYKGIDIFKLIMALLVVVLHTHPFYHMNGTVNFVTADVLGRIAVPYFFTITGFLLENKIRQSGEPAKNVIRDYIIRILKLYVFWTAIYLPIIIYTKVINSERGMKYGFFTMIRDFVFNGSYAHLWYLPATAVGVLLVFFFKVKIGNKKTAAILLLFFFFGLLAQSYFGLLRTSIEVDGVTWNILKVVKMIIVTSRNGVFFGGLFIYIGAAAAESGFYLNWRPYISRIAMAFFILLLACEEVWLHRIGYVREEDMYLMLIPVAFFTLLVSLQLEIKGKTDFLRKMSMNIYFIHMIFKFVYREFFGDYNEVGMALFVFTLGGTLLLIGIAYVFKLIQKSCGSSKVIKGK